jgi:hypothetical protein
MRAGWSGTRRASSDEVVSTSPRRTKDALSRLPAAPATWRFRRPFGVALIMSNTRQECMTAGRAYQFASLLSRSTVKTAVSVRTTSTSPNLPCSVQSRSLPGWRGLFGKSDTVHAVSKRYVKQTMNHAAHAQHVTYVASAAGQAVMTGYGSCKPRGISLLRGVDSARFGLRVAESRLSMHRVQCALQLNYPIKLRDPAFEAFPIPDYYT